MKSKTAILVLNGPEFNQKEFESLYSPEKYLVAVDGGIRHLRQLKVAIDMHMGDMDSSGTGTPQNVKSSWSFPPEKDRSDFELAMEHVLFQEFETVEIFAAVGGRTDHFISNYDTAVKYAVNGVNIIFHGINERIYFINNPKTFNFAVGTTVSIFSGTSKTDDVYLEGFKYNVKGLILERSSPLGLSNVAEDNVQSVSFTNGLLVVIENLQKV